MTRLFAVSAPGLEVITRQELANLKISEVSPVDKLSAGEADEEGGGVEFEGDTADLYRVNLRLRTCSRVLVRLGDFFAAAFSELRKKASRLPWETYLSPGQPVAVRTTCHKSRLYHSDGVSERIAGAISDRLGQASLNVKFDDTASQTPQLVVVRLVHDHCTISIDSSGGLLHRRGYRLETAKAPLRETLAAAMVIASGWDSCSPLIDPFCGSGTIPIEAALIARQIAPGKNRHFAFMDWLAFDPRLWAAVLYHAVSEEQACAAPILASDRDAGAIRIAQANARRAGVLEDIQFDCQAVSAINPPHGPGWLVTNPPYGVRVSPSNDLRNLYAQFGNVLRSQLSGWRVGVLCSSDFLIGHAHLGLSGQLRLVNGGIPVTFYLGKVPGERSTRRSRQPDIINQ